MCGARNGRLGLFRAKMTHFPAVADGIEQAAVADGTGVAAGRVW